MATVRPILFSAPMVRAILAEVASPGQGKTQTRRLIKPQPSKHHWRTFKSYGIEAKLLSCQGGSFVAFRHSFDEHGVANTETERASVPYAVGDRLWVRETFVIEDTGEYDSDAVIPADGRPIKHETCEWNGSWRLIPHYRATEPEPHIVCEDSMVDDSDDRTRWRPGIHMPRWASRLTLEVTNVRVERLQDISEADAIAEGVDTVSMADVPRQAAWNRRHDFSRLWDSINADRAPWSSNPWVVAVTFKPHLVNVDAFAAQRAKETA